MRRCTTEMDYRTYQSPQSCRNSYSKTCCTRILTLDEACRNPRHAFCSILGVSRAASQRGMSLPDNGSRKWCARRSPAFVFIFIHRTSPSMVSSLSVDMCFFLADGYIRKYIAELPVGWLYEPVSPFEDSCQDESWNWKPQRITGPLRCS